MAESPVLLLGGAAATLLKVCVCCNFLPSLLPQEVSKFSKAKHKNCFSCLSWFFFVCVCCSSICTLVQFVFVPVQNILNWYKIFCASPIFNFIVQFVVNLQY